MQADIVETSGSWFSYGGQRIGQGRENAKAFLGQNPEVAAEVEQKIRANAGLKTEPVLTVHNEDDPVAAKAK